MRYLHSDVIAALAQRRGAARMLLWMSARNRDTNAIEYAGVWNGRGDLDVTVIDGFTGDEEERTFIGSEGLFSVSEIPLIADISVRELHVRFNPDAAAIIQFLRTYDPKGGQFQLYLGFMNPDSHAFIDYPRALFVGFIDRTPINLTTGHDKSEATVVAVSHTRELTRVNPIVRSSEFLHTRAPGDDFYQYTSSIQNWELFWGKNPGPEGRQR